jgi:hypothetical protein
MVIFYSVAWGEHGKPALASHADGWGGTGLAKEILKIRPGMKMIQKLSSARQLVNDAH